MDVRLTDDVATVAVRGELDIATIAPLEDRVRAACELMPCVVVDLTGVNFIDFRTVVMLERNAAAMRDRGGRLSVRPGPRARRVLELVGAESLVKT